MQLFLWILAIYSAYKLLVFNFLATLGFELLLYQWFRVTNRQAAVTSKNIYFVVVVSDLLYMAYAEVNSNLLLFFTHLGIMGVFTAILIASGEAMEKYINTHAQKRPWD